eukprot:TRINITY_DN16704_c0_g1_i2.p1 TRINITY_DN16704_c0_g1~~TRINITY_DN16704_c0_g1_i2.p1  ORF type:complete len:274 (+),score=25.45 TRINITY_DN16704_c0_g1_i2:65-823(+)
MSEGNFCVDVEEFASRDLLPSGGQMLFSCLTGSRAYNLHHQESDVDVFVVWAAPTRAVLTLQSDLKDSYRNPQDVKPDFNIHEVKQYCRLLTMCDPRAVECLFATHNVGTLSTEWQELHAIRHHFLCKILVHKYISHIDRELRMLDRADVRDNVKMCLKKTYVIARLFHFVDKMLKGETMELWFEEDSVERRELMEVRAGRIHVPSFLSEAKQRSEQCKKRLEASTLPENPDHTFAFLDDWLIRIRRKLFTE